MLKYEAILKYHLRLANTIKQKGLFIVNPVIQLKKNKVVQRYHTCSFSKFFSSNIGKFHFSTQNTQNQEQKPQKRLAQQFQKIVSQIKDLDIKDPKNHRKFLAYAAQNGSVGDFQKMISICKQILSHKPERQTQLLSYLSLARAYIQKKQLQTALEYLRKVEPEASKHLDLYQFYNLISGIFIYQSKFQQAAKYNEMAYNLNSKDPLNICQIGQSYFRAKKFDKVQQWATKAVNQFPKNKLVLSIFAQLKSKIGKFQQANQLFDKTLQIDPNQDHVYTLKLQALIGHRKTQQALKFFRKASAQRPQLKNKGQFAYFGGLILHQFRLFQEAISELLKVTIDEVVFPNAQHALGNCYLELHKFDDAHKYYQKATKLNRNLFASFVGVGTCYHLKGDKEKAIEYYDKALSLQPNYYDAHIRKGAVYHEMQRFNEAIMHYKKAIQLNPNQVDAWQNLGHCLIHTKKYEQAINCYDKYLIGHPENKQVLSNKSYCLNNLRRFSESKPILQAIINDFPTFENYVNLAVCHRMFFDLDEAQICLKKALQIQPGRFQAIEALNQIQILKNNQNN